MGPQRPSFSHGKPLPEGMLLKLPEARRDRLGAPFGDVFEGSEIPARVAGAPSFAVVGDVTASSALYHKLKPRFIVVDFKTKRGPVARDDDLRAYGDKVEKVECPAGFMTAALYNAVLRAAKSTASTRIEVEGEEDLAVMPAIIHLEAGATVIYGLPNRGATLVKVDDESRRVAREFLKSFEVISH